mmetsp:Transcript_6265/g.8203  ORF Transcript_6265/g.8203 Transcript_6265/m.8203 type:complete len:351 (-) Transcript_6265:1476-2528(-)
MDVKSPQEDRSYSKQEEEKSLTNPINPKMGNHEDDLSSATSTSRKRKRNRVPPRRGMRRSSRTAPTSERSNDAILDLSQILKQQKNVVFITGAGLSVASGIPPFRGASDAVWEQSLHEWGTREKFEENPLLWYNTFWLKHFDEGKAHLYKPNAGHEALAKICKAYNATAKVITQNIDGLHRHSTGKIEDDQLIEIHGFHGAFKCYTDDCPYSTSKLFYGSLEVKRNKGHSKVTSAQNIPHCPECKAVMCPNCLLFDEDYDDHESYQFERAQEWLKQANAIVFVGTSFAVHLTNVAFEFARNNKPAAGIFNINVIDNLPATKAFKLQTSQIIGKAEQILPQISLGALPGGP